MASGPISLLGIYTGNLKITHITTCAFSHYRLPGLFNNLKPSIPSITSNPSPKRHIPQPHTNKAPHHSYTARLRATARFPTGSTIVQFCLCKSTLAEASTLHPSFEQRARCCTRVRCRILDAGRITRGRSELSLPLPHSTSRFMSTVYFCHTCMFLLHTYVGEHNT